MRVLACKVSINSPECLGTLLLSSVANQLPGSSPTGRRRVMGANLLFLSGAKPQLTEDWCPQSDCNLHAGKCLVPGAEVGVDACQVVCGQDGDSCHHALPYVTALSLPVSPLVHPAPIPRAERDDTAVRQPK